ncbi:hypothetical protein HYT52_05365 [Candidatus Woesearchaeota archaeon]|nr:hypothetical protein [Candidatus Woesearchaeota archaeon]
MHFKKEKVLVFVVLALALSLTSCSTGKGIFPNGVSDNLESAWNGLKEVASNVCDLDEEDLAAITRFLVAGGLGSKAGLVISAFLAIVTFLFIPPSILSFIGAAYTGIVVWVLVFAPLVGGIYLWLRVREAMGHFHWVMLALICVGLAVIYGYGMFNFSYLIGGC